MSVQTTPIPDNPQLREILDQTADHQRNEFFSSGWWHSIDLGDGRVTPGVHHIDELRDNYARFGLPEDMRGMRLLDIGCWDGFYSFESERRGAEVVSVDCWRPEKFFEAHHALNSKIQFHELSVYEVTKEKLGQFDVVLFLGVLYHLRHPLLALERVCEVSRHLAVIESHVVDNVLRTPRPVMEFYEVDELGGQYDNWWGPNVECIARMARAAGFVTATPIRRDDLRGVVKASRLWDGLPTEPAPSLKIHEIVNAIKLNHEFPHRGKHAFLTIWAEGLPETVSRDTVQVTIGGVGTRPVYAGASKNPADPVLRVQINIAIPPGVDPGDTPIRIYHENKMSEAKVIALSEGTEW
ncbi:MAG: methyltransferase domain-containing protein [Blastocatellia bacterium]